MQSRAIWFIKESGHFRKFLNQSLSKHGPLPHLLSPVSTTRVDGPCWRVMETGHPSTRAVNSGSGNWALPVILICECAKIQSRPINSNSIAVIPERRRWNLEASAWAGRGSDRFSLVAVFQRSLYVPVYSQNYSIQSINKPNSQSKRIYIQRHGKLEMSGYGELSCV